MAARTVQVGGQLRVQANGHVDPVDANAGPPVLELLDDLRDRPAVVTGAARGIGEAIAKWLIVAGADVTVIDKDAKSLKDAFRTEDCQVIEADLHKEDAGGLADELTRNRPVELLVNNVGITTPTSSSRSGPRSSTWCWGPTSRGRGCSPTGWSRR
jgi:hypothetical protein